MVLQKDEDDWLNRSKESNRGSDHVSKPVVQTAIGLWLFPIKFFTALTDYPNNNSPSPDFKCYDMRTHRPDLCLVNLPILSLRDRAGRFSD